MTINCALIDDDRVFLETMKHYIEKVDYLKLSNEYTDPGEAFNSLDFSTIDILFLDMEMPQMTGSELLSSLSFAPPVVFVSGKKEYAIDAFDFNAVDYLHKPVSYQRFLKTADKIKEQYSASLKRIIKPSGYLFIRVEGYWLKVDMSELQIIKADNNNVFVKTCNRDFKCNQRLKDLVDQLPKEKFMQVHRSYIVNLEQIIKVDGEVIQVADRIVPVSKPFMSELYNRLNIPR